MRPFTPFRISSSARVSPLGTTPPLVRTMDHKTTPARSPHEAEFDGSVSLREMPQRTCSSPPGALSSNRPPVFRPGPCPSYQSQWRAENHQDERSASLLQTVPEPNTREHHPQWRRDDSTDDDLPSASAVKARKLHQPQYKPYALRWPFLTALLLSVFTLAGLLGVALHFLPIEHTDSLGQMTKRAVPNQPGGHSPRHRHSRPIFDAISDRGMNMSIPQSLDIPSEATTTKTIISPVEITSILADVSGGLVKEKGLLRPSKNTITIHREMMHRTDSSATTTMRSITPNAKASAAVVEVLVGAEKLLEADERAVTPSEEIASTSTITSTVSGFAVPALPEQTNSRLKSIDEPNYGAYAGLLPGAFMRPGKVIVTIEENMARRTEAPHATITIHENSRQTTKAAVTTSTTRAVSPLFPASGRSEPMLLSGIFDLGNPALGVGSHGFLKGGKVTIELREASTPRTELVIATTIVSKPPEAAPTLISQLHGDGGSNGGKVGVAGFFKPGKKTITFVDVLRQRTEVPFPITPITATVTDGVAAASKPLVEVFSQGWNLPKSRYSSLNQSTTTRTGRSGLPMSSYHSSQNPVSTARVPLNTFRPKPNATTLQVTTVVYNLQMGSYFVCFFLPTLLCTLLQIPVRMLDQSVRLLQPFHEMTDENGATGRDSLWLETAGWRCRVASLRHTFSRKQSLVFLTGVLQIITWLVVSFSATAVGLQLVGSGCDASDPYSVQNNCAMTPAVFWRPTIILLSLLGIMAAILSFIMVRLPRWDAGVTEDPWSISTRRATMRRFTASSQLGLSHY